MPVRQAVDADIAEMHRVRMSVRVNVLSESTVITEEMYRKHLEKIGRGWVWEEDGRILGCAVANLRDASIWGLFVAPEAEGRGIGRALHDTMLDWLRSEGATEVKLGTEPGTRAARFYEAAGWRFKQIDGKGEAVYVKRLDG